MTEQRPETLEESRLVKFVYLQRLIGLASILVFGSIAYFFADYLPFVIYPKLLWAAFLSLFFATLVIFIIVDALKRKNLFYLANFAWLIFYLIAVYSSGGTNSPAIVLLVFPLLTSAFDLNPKITKIIGIVVVTAFGLMIFTYPKSQISILFPQHAILTAILAIIAYYMYKIVKETLRHKYEQEKTKREYLELIELNRIKYNFITVASHQLRTPLSGIRWGLNAILESSNINKDEREIASQSLKRIDDSMAIIDKMLKTIEGQKIGLAFSIQRVDIVALIDDIIHSLEYVGRQNNTEIHFKKGSRLYVDADKEKLAIALTNVIDNAIRYSPGGHVDIAAIEKDNKAEIVIKDTGIGIAPEDLPFIFEQFFRGKNAIKLHPNESGVGLFIAKEIIERHGGTITIDSTLNKGTTVTILLPTKTGGNA